jgi:hypothetical protein
MARLLSVNVGLPREITWRGKTVDWAAPHFLVHLEWEFLERLYKSVCNHILTCDAVLLLSQDALNSFGVA